MSFSTSAFAAKPVWVLHTALLCQPPVNLTILVRV